MTAKKLRESAGTALPENIVNAIIDAFFGAGTYW